MILLHFPLLPDKTDKIAKVPAAIRAQEESFKKKPLLKMA